MNFSQQQLLEKMEIPSEALMMIINIKNMKNLLDQKLLIITKINFELIII
jgi:hypothetical protein